MLALLFAAMAAGGVLPPEPIGNPGRWATDEDYPLGAQRRKAEGDVSFQLTLSAAGVPERCTVTKTSGDPDLDAKTCALMMVRARFQPATDHNGAATLSTYGNRLTWALPSDKRRRPDPKWLLPEGDIQLTVARLPQGLRSPQLVLLGVSVLETGETRGCGARDKPKMVQLAAVACAQALKGLTFSSLRTVAGQPVASVQMVRVVFVTAK